MTNNSWTCSRRRLLAAVAFLGLACSASLTGCGGTATVAPVTGKVTYKGEVVKGGTLVFGPVGTDKGKPGNAEVQADGTFTVNTYGKGDGAVIGKHKVTYSPPEQVLTEEQRKDPKYIAPPAAYTGLSVKTPEVEVKTGPNTIEIELVGVAKK